MSKTLREKTINGVIWSAVERISFLGIQFLITILIARALTPSDYGLIGMLSIFIALGSVMIDSGFGQALIRKKDANQTDYSSVFFLNVFLGIVIYLILFLLAPIIANFYNTPELTKIARVAFLVFPINALGLIQNTLINKSVNFKALAKVSILSSILSGIIGIFMAYNGFGVWALVAQSIIINAFKSIFLWVFNNWRPSNIFSFSSIKNIFNFSVNLLATDSIIVLFNNIYTLIIGKFYPISQVGFYNQAKTFVDIPSQTLTMIIQRVSYPVLSTLQDNNTELRSAYRRVINLTVYLNFPLMLGLLSMGNNLFTLLLTDKWIPAVPYFQILCIYGAIFPLHSINVNILKVKGKGKLLMRLEIIRRLLMIIAIVFTIKEGVMIMLIGFLLAAIISILINMYYCGNEIGLSLSTQLKDILIYLSISILISTVMIFVDYINVNSLVSIILQVFVGGSIYFILSYFLKLSSFVELKGILFNLIKKNQNEQ